MAAVSLSLDILQDELLHTAKHTYTDRRWPEYITNIKAKIGLMLDREIRSLKIRVPRKKNHSLSI